MPNYYLNASIYPIDVSQTLSNDNSLVTSLLQAKGFVVNSVILLPVVNTPKTYAAVISLQSNITIGLLAKVKSALGSKFGVFGLQITNTDYEQTTDMANNYIVQSGDTLSKIGAKLGIKWQDIAKWNNIKSPYIIQIGQQLVINGVTQANTTPVITGTNTNGTVQVTKTQLPDKPKEKSFLDSLSESLGIAPYVVGVAGVAVLLILVVPRKK